MAANIYHVNLFKVAAAALPPRQAGGSPPYGRPGWNGWGRAIFYMEKLSEVDALYAQLLAKGQVPEFAPNNASFGERYFQILDPTGHELSFSFPLT